MTRRADGREVYADLRVRAPLVVRADGRGFGALLRKAKKPYDPNFAKAMARAARTFVEESGLAPAIAFTFSDEIKSGIREVISALKTKGIERTVMLSGDRQAKAGLVSQSLGLDEFHAELLPSHKLEKLEQIMAATTGKVAYVGDGMNDAPTLARADVGLAMGSIGNQASIEAADIVLLNDQPRQLAAVFELSRRTGFVVAQNIVFALAVKALVMGLGISGISGLWEAIIADVGVTLLVVFNSLRMLRSERRP